MLSTQNWTSTSWIVYTLTHLPPSHLPIRLIELNDTNLMGIFRELSEFKPSPKWTTPCCKSVKMHKNTTKESMEPQMQLFNQTHKSLNPKPSKFKTFQIQNPPISFWLRSCPPSRLLCTRLTTGNRTRACFWQPPGPPYGQALGKSSLLVNELLPRACLLIFALEVWSLRLRLGWFSSIYGLKYRVPKTQNNKRFRACEQLRCK